MGRHRVSIPFLSLFPDGYEVCGYRLMNTEWGGSPFELRADDGRDFDAFLIQRTLVVTTVGGAGFLRAYADQLGVMPDFQAVTLASTTDGTVRPPVFCRAAGNKLLLDHTAGGGWAAAISDYSIHVTLLRETAKRPAPWKVVGYRAFNNGDVATAVFTDERALLCDDGGEYDGLLIQYLGMGAATTALDMLLFDPEASLTTGFLAHFARSAGQQPAHPVFARHRGRRVKLILNGLLNAQTFYAVAVTLLRRGD